MKLSCRRQILPALLRPGHYAGPQGDRTKEEWQADAILSLSDGQPVVEMDRYSARLEAFAVGHNQKMDKRK